MPRICTCVTFSIVGLLLAAGARSADVARTSESLLPDTTKGLVAVADVKLLRDQWNKTQIGKLMADPAMEPFTEDLERQFESRWSGVQDRLGLTLDDLKDVAGGEVGVAMILPKPDKAALAIVVDVTDHVKQANELLDKISKNLIKQGAKETRHQVGKTTVILFDVPPPKEDPEVKPTKVNYFLADNLLGASDDVDVIEGILARATQNQGKSLADVEAFKTVMGRCAEDAGGVMPQIRWFIDPLGYVAAVRAATPPEYRRKGKPIIEILRNQGFEALQGVGGFVDFAAEGFEIVHRTSVYAPPPYARSMKMLVFPNGKDYAPQPWVPRDVAAYTTFYCDILNAFDNFGPLFDELSGGEVFLFSIAAKHGQELDAGTLSETFRKKFMEQGIKLSEQPAVTTREAGETWKIKDAVADEGELAFVVRRKDDVLIVYEEPTGIWEEVLRSLKEDPNGPQIDLRKELIEQLQQRVTVITDYETPITPTSERLLFAIETANPKLLAETIRKTMENDPSAKKREIDGQIIWEIVEEEIPDLPKVEFGGDIPSLRPGDDDGEEEEKEEEEEEGARLLPHAAVTVVQGDAGRGHLFVASHMDFLLKVLEPREERETLGRTVDYRMIEATIEQLKAPAKCVQSFTRTDEAFRPTYELIRQGKMPQSEGVLGRLLNAMFGQGKEGEVRKQKIEGGKLPEFDVVRRSLGPAGLTVTSEENGWFVKGFTLTKQ